MQVFLGEMPFVCAKKIQRHYVWGNVLSEIWVVVLYCVLDRDRGKEKVNCIVEWCKTTHWKCQREWKTHHGKNMCFFSVGVCLQWTNNTQRYANTTQQWKNTHRTWNICIINQKGIIYTTAPKRLKYRNMQRYFPSDVFHIWCCFYNCCNRVKSLKNLQLNIIPSPSYIQNESHCLIFDIYLAWFDLITW